MNLGAIALDHTPRILIVDDEFQNRKLLEAILSSEGFDLTHAASGEEALRITGQHATDLILLDVMMPGIDGYEVARTIKENPVTQNIPIIMVTALGDRDARMRGLGAGAEDFLSKPVDRAELCARVKNLLRLKAYGDLYGRYSEVLEDEVRARTADLAERSARLEERAVALRRSEERTNYALGGANMGVWELDVATGTISCSDTMARVLGVDPRDCPKSAKAFLALVHNDDRRAVGEAVSQVVRLGTDLALDFRVLWPDGTTHWLSGRARMMRDADGNAARLLGVGVEISERKSLEAQLRQSQKMEAVGQLAGGIAHDFNNLLTVIMSYSDLVLHDLPTADTHRDDVQQVINAAGSAASLTRQLLAFSRKQVLKPTIVHLNALVAEMELMFRHLMSGQIELVTILYPELSAVRADRSQLEQVLMNLVVNARDAMPKGGRVEIETANVELADSPARHADILPGLYVMMSVRDRGIGMDEATQERLFEPFFTTKEPGKGTGLGLATVYGIVQQSGGFITVHSAPAKGATFKVFLPRA